jgi:Ricin-type beta-trefoil lectin domain
MRTSPRRITAAAIAVAAVLGTGLALAVSPATAAARPAPARAATGATWFQLRSADVANACVAEKGTGSSIAGVPCTSNHSDFWKWTSTGELLNEHSGKCLSVTGSDPGVYVNTCGNNHAQLWLNQPVPVIAGGKLYSYTEYVNVHTRESLALNATTSGTAVLQQSSGDTLWTVP